MRCVKYLLTLVLLFTFGLYVPVPCFGSEEYVGGLTVQTVIPVDSTRGLQEYDALKREVLDLKWPTDGNGMGKEQHIIAGSSQVFRFDRPIVRTAVSNPEVCDIVPISNDQILINSSTPGRMNLIVWDEWNDIAVYDVQSTVDTSSLQRLLGSIDPTSEVAIVPFKETVAIYGTADTARKVEQMREVAKVFDDSAVSFVDIKDPKQILLEVRFVEINRNHDSEFKLDADVLTRYIQARSMTGQTGVSNGSTWEISGVPENAGLDSTTAIPTFGAPVIAQAVSNLVGTYTSHGFYVTPVLKWLEEKNLLKIIARPNILAKDGEEASFVVGGELAIPVSSDGDISIQYQDYGTKVKFTPEVLNDTLMRLKIETEVSELDYANTVSIGSTEVPSLLKREQTTVAELHDGQSLVIGGMISQRMSRINNKMPVLSDLPVLGLLFKNETVERADVELLVVVTPHMVRPFVMDDTRTLYNPEDVAQAVRIIHPPYEDEHADAIDRLVAEEEDYTFFDDLHRKKVLGEHPDEVRRKMKYSALFEESDTLFEKSD